MFKNNKNLVDGTLLPGQDMPGQQVPAFARGWWS